MATVDPNTLAQTQAAISAAHATWSGAIATWVGVGVTGLLGVANVMVLLMLAKASNDERARATEERNAAADINIRHALETFLQVADLIEGANPESKFHVAALRPQLAGAVETLKLVSASATDPTLAGVARSGQTAIESALQSLDIAAATIAPKFAQLALPFAVNAAVARQGLRMLEEKRFLHRVA